MENKEQKGFVVYGDIEETLDALTDEQAAKLFRGMVKYFNTGEDPNFSGVLKLAFIPIRQQMDRDVNKYEKKCQRNRENIQKYWNKVKAEKDSDNTTEYERIRSNTNEYEKIRSNTIATNTNTKTKTNTNKDTNTKTNTNTMPEETGDPSSLSSLLISHLNETAGTNYNVTAAVTERVAELLNAGYTEADMKRVIDSKVSEWKGSDKMRGYLRPRTLFGDKFEEYASAPVPMEVEKNQEQRELVTRLKRQRSEKAEDLASIVRSLEDLRNSSGGIRGNPDEWQRLKDQEALTEDAISHIDARLEKLGG